MVGLTLALPALSQNIRIATYYTDLERKGPGLLLRDILGGKDPQVVALGQVIAHVAPDVILLTSFDFDLGGHALRAFADHLRGVGIDYPYAFTSHSNSGIATGLDMNGDGWLGDADDAQGFGDFAGQGGMAVLSKLPILQDGVRDFSSMLWQDFPDAQSPSSDGTLALQRLSSVAHWDIPIQLPDLSVLRLFAFHAGTPAFGGDGDRNQNRNHDEVSFWQTYLDGRLAIQPTNDPFIVIGDANLDPHDGLGRQSAIQNLLSDVRLRDLRPRSAGAAIASNAQGGVNANQTGDPALDTADWPDENGPGNLRVDYVLPSVKLNTGGAGVFWPAPTDPDAAVLQHDGVAASRHALVWVDIVP